MQDINKTRKIIEKFILFLKEKSDKISDEMLKSSKIILVNDEINKNIFEAKLILDTLKFFEVMLEVPDFKGAAIVDFQKFSEYLVESSLT